MVLNVLRYVTYSIPCCVRRARFVFRLVEGVKDVRVLRMVTSLAMIVIYSISICQLAHALLMRWRAVGVRGIGSATCGLGIAF